MPAGRPTTYSPKLVATICERLADGESLRSICRDEDMPAVSTVCKWLAEHKEFSEQYAKARELQADSLFDEVLDIADDARNDWMLRNAGEDAAWQVNGEHIQRSKLRIDARKWMAGKLAPKKYGERITTELTGKDGGPIETKDATDPRQRARAIALLLAEAATGE